MEINLAQFYRRHLAPTLGGSHLPLLAGFDPPTDAKRQAIASLDWWYAPMARRCRATPMPRLTPRWFATARHAEARRAKRRWRQSPAPARPSAGCSPMPSTWCRFGRSRSRELTIAWPVMRRAVLRIGEALVERGVIGEPEDVFFLTRDEADCDAHRRARAEQPDRRRRAPRDCGRSRRGWCRRCSSAV